MLTEEELEKLRVVYTKVGVVDWNAHQLVFRMPSRDMIRDYRRMQESPAEKPDAMDQLSQRMMIAFDGNTDPVRCREMYISFLENESQAFTSSNKAMAVIGGLSGIVEEADAIDLGKGARILTASRKPSPADSPNGSVTSLAARS